MAKNLVDISLMGLRHARAEDDGGDGGWSFIKLPANIHYCSPFLLVAPLLGLGEQADIKKLSVAPAGRFFTDSDGYTSVYFTGLAMVCSGEISSRLYSLQKPLWYSA